MVSDPASPQQRPSRAKGQLPRRGLERLDLMLLCAEALDLNGAEATVWLSEQLGFAGLFPSRVDLWKSRCHNPLRRYVFESRLQELLSERMNLRRGGVQRLLGAESGQHQRRQLIRAMALGAGQGGFERLKASLMDAAA